jgi:hypothetical protein
MMKRYITLSAGLLALLALSGCGAGSAERSLESFSNLLGLDGGELVGISRAELPATPTREQSYSRTFEDRAIAGPRRPLDSVGGSFSNARWTMTQGIGRSVRVTVPDGVALPTSFTLSNINLTLTITDGTRVAERTTTIAGPVVFTRSGESNLYTSRSEYTPEAVFPETTQEARSSFEMLHQILTTAPSPNTSTAILRYDASAELPAGATLRFALRGGQARLQR